MTQTLNNKHVKRLEERGVKIYLSLLFLLSLLKFIIYVLSFSTISLSTSHSYYFTKFLLLHNSHCFHFLYLIRGERDMYGVVF